VGVAVGVCSTPLGSSDRVCVGFVRVSRLDGSRDERDSLVDVDSLGVGSDSVLEASDGSGVRVGSGLFERVGVGDLVV